MKANVSLIASDLATAREQADEAFKDFFGETLFEIVGEEAESHTVVGTDAGEQRVVAWRCDFTARLVEEPQMLPDPEFETRKGGS